MEQKKPPARGHPVGTLLLFLSGDTTRADEGNRTPNLLITNQLLYQLSYVSLMSGEKRQTAS
jgi:hypothetical protein